MLQHFDLAELDAAAALLHGGGVLAYPTEAVFGLGCDPHDRAAFVRVFALKQRPANQGVLLIAADFGQVERYIDLAAVPDEILQQVRASWPGPHTWIFPRAATVPAWVAGAHAGIALRITAHEPAAALCRAFGGALVSTSARSQYSGVVTGAIAVGTSALSGVRTMISPLRVNASVSSFSRVSGDQSKPSQYCQRSVAGANAAVGASPQLTGEPLADAAAAHA